MDTCQLSKEGPLVGSTLNQDSLFPLFVHGLVYSQCLDYVVDGRLCLCVASDALCFGHVGLPEEELMQQGVNGVRALHHHHVTPLLDDFEKCKQENLVAEGKKNEGKCYATVQSQRF